jgi:hypothetical protein
MEAKTMRINAVVSIPLRIICVTDNVPLQPVEQGGGIAICPICGFKVRFEQQQPQTSAKTLNPAQSKFKAPQPVA